ncbi:response regulator [Frigidibacter sp. MR17.14]|uniref:response regulator transcription factor n=1 Tax=Frigidibacter sp. MR17.14 TaxID=3126509 RepID=UPI003012C0EB
MTPRVHIVDDEEPIRDALSWLFASRGIEAVCWPTGEALLAALGPDGAPEGASCIILDVRMGGLTGPETFERLRAAGCRVPVIFLTGHADVPIAVAALKAGAFDFVEKPFSDNQIVDQALAASDLHARLVSEAARERAVEERLGSLSSREREVMELMLTGSLNKQIADTLDIAMRTVEVHRGRVLAKMGVRNAMELAALIGARPR